MGNDAKRPSQKIAAGEAEPCTSARIERSGGVRGRRATPSEFEARYGQEVVAQVRKAVYVTAVFIIRNSSLEETRDVKASFQAAADWGLFSGNLQANYADCFRQAAEMHTVNVVFFALGGEGLTKLSEILTIDPVQDAGKTLAKISTTFKNYMDKLSLERSVAVE